MVIEFESQKIHTEGNAYTVRYVYVKAFIPVAFLYRLICYLDGGEFVINCRKFSIPMIESLFRAFPLSIDTQHIMSHRNSFTICITIFSIILFLFRITRYWNCPLKKNSTHPRRIKKIMIYNVHENHRQKFSRSYD